MNIRYFALCIALFSPVAACGNGGPSRPSADGGIVLDDRCNAYLASYEACARDELRGHPELVAARVAQARTGLLRAASAEQAGTLCVSGTARLRASCH